MPTYYIINYFDKCTLKNVSDKEIDNDIETLELAIRRCKLLHKGTHQRYQLVIIEQIQHNYKIVKILDAPTVLAVISLTKTKFDAYVKYLRYRGCHTNSIFIRITKYDDIKDKTFDYYHLLSGWEEIDDHDRIIQEVKCRCSSEESSLAAQDRYDKRFDHQSY